MPYLIDGYNLLHAMGVLHGRAGPTGLEKARLRLLGLLGGAFADEPGQVTVVFDGAGARPGAKAEQDFRGVRVRFALRPQQADDLIEFLIQHDSAPRHLTVVSDDHRIQQAARRRHCAVRPCADFLEEIGRRRRPRSSAAPEPEKAQALSPEEVQRWLEEFADLADDPDVKELFDQFGFREE